MHVATVAPGADFGIASVQTLFPLRNLEASSFDLTKDGRFVMLRLLAPPASARAGNRMVMLEHYAREVR